MTVSAWLAVATGGAVGAVMRFALSSMMTRTPGSFPIAHFAANVIGSVLIGVLFVALVNRTDLMILRLFLITGVLGAFTTFSAFSLDTLQLAERGQWLPAAAYVLSTVVLCVAGCWAGMLVGRLAIR
ncbi:MAG: fluoride efflux transporter CrcB [Pseudomonadota bacterium]